MKSEPCLIDAVSLKELESGLCADPFRHLGFHHHSAQGRTSALIRVYNPAFQNVMAIIEGKAWETKRKTGTGCFEIPLDSLDFTPYRLRATTHNGSIVEYDDAYSLMPVLGDFDLHLISRGTHYQLWKRLGANARTHQDLSGVHFAVWAPHARGVALISDFNGWNPRSHMMRKLAIGGVWEIFIPHIGPGVAYKFLIHTEEGTRLEKLDPLAREAELRPKTASVVTDPTIYPWQDGTWEKERAERQSDNAPMSVYEVHLGSWRKHEGKEFLSYDELGDWLIPYIQEMGYTHIELLPIAEHPLDESWGYQVTGYYAPTKRHGTPQQFKRLIDRFHAAGIGVLLDWVPGHFPADLHALDWFDGTQLYAHVDPRRGEHPEWGTRVFNFARHEVANFLIANALYWLEEFHIDGLRVDAVASMLYLDYARAEGQWIPNADGGNISYEAVEFLKHLNSVVSQRYPSRLIIAEESTSFPGITHPLDHGGLGFGYKWNLGWMHDLLTYLGKDPLYRRYHQDLLTFEMSYAFSERFMLVLSHDEVVHGKGSLPNKMPGDAWMKLAQCRLAFAHLFAHPGKKLHFMGLEFAQWSEWNCKSSLDWHILADPLHAGLKTLVRDLNHLYRTEKALFAVETSWEGFRWVDFEDRNQNVISFLRLGPDDQDGNRSILLCVFHFGSVTRPNYRIGCPNPGVWTEILNTDAGIYGGSNVGNLGAKATEPKPMHHFPHSMELCLPPSGALIFRFEAHQPS